MEDTNSHPETDTETAHSTVAAGVEEAEAIKSRFARAIDDAKANAQDLRSNAAEIAAAAREKAGSTANELTEQAGALAKQARDKSLDAVRVGKDKTSEAIASVGRAIGDTAPVIDEKLGVQYGDYARNAAGALETSAEKLAAKDIADLTQDVAAFVRKSPATALGLAAVTGFLLARLFSRSGERDA
ncbi:hypothetical protein [Novosphingobium acidiphilum]|jgi:ElaB/YqjD/DUF883 family membrane-anchored ribosome-binding protein|uniref:hypothetical protein n=1 Tax=Novosphingobium acidiphilum TaxID=505248 RepID=UPI00041E8064|nr:hypothetical protein [Novosphingobium acidiphilum]